MKKFLFPACAFLAGLSLGLATMFWVIAHGPDKVIAGQELAFANQNVVYATLLHDQRYEDLQRLLTTNLSASLDSMSALGYTRELGTSSRLVRGYYDLSGTQIPTAIAPYLIGVKGMDVRTLAEFETAHANR